MGRTDGQNSDKNFPSDDQIANTLMSLRDCSDPLQHEALLRSLQAGPVLLRIADCISQSRDAGLSLAPMTETDLA